MSKPLFYKPPPKWHVLINLSAAIAIELTAVALASHAETDRIPTITGLTPNREIVGVIIDETPEPTPPPELTPPLPPPPADNDDFVVVAPSPPPRPVKSVPSRVSPQVTRPSNLHQGPTNFSPGENEMLFAPHPTYPYEAKRLKQTGSGKFLLTFSPNGDVAGVDSVVSTGSPILDQVTADALRQWRCKPGAYTRMFVPITFTLAGIQL